jgi:hypothetical protein
MDLPLPITNNRKDHIIQRSFEILPGFLTWLTFFLMIWFSFTQPVWVALFIIVFDVYWIIRGIFITSLTVTGYEQMKLNIAINWLDRCKGVSKNFDNYLELKKNELQRFDKKVAAGEQPKFFEIENSHIMRLKINLSPRKQRKIMVQHIKELERIEENINQKKGILNWAEVEHVVSIATLLEPIEVLTANIDAIAKSNYPRKKMHIFIGFEENAIKKGDDVESKRKILEKKYKKVFAHFETTLHPLLPNEKPGKGSNETWISKKIKIYLDQKGFDYKKVLYSSFDSEAYVHKEYFGVITYNFIMSENRTHVAFQPLPFFSNTIWYAPAYSRINGLTSTFWHMVESVRSERLVTFSNQAHSFQAVYDANYWPVNYVVNDDSVIFWRCYFHYEGNYQTVPVYVPISVDCVYAGSMWKTFKASYQQRRRWAYGVEHLGPIARACLKSKKISLYEKARHIFILIEGNHSWSTSSIIILVLGWLPIYLGGAKFNQWVIATNLTSLTQILATSAMIFLVASVYMGYILVPDRPKKYPWWKNALMLYQWLLVPIISTIFGALPAIDAQTRLMLGKYMGFKVTPKEREIVDKK